MNLLAISWFLIVAATAGGLAVAILLTLAPRMRERPPWTKILLLAAVLASGLLLLRPHEDTFTGLDVSGYRLLADSLARGHALRGPDRTLLEVPLALRDDFLFLSGGTRWRNARDISFQMLSLDSAETQPYFYPMLPWFEIGFDSIIPGDVRDYGLPVLAWLFFAVCLAVGAGLGGAGGLMLAAVLLVGSPMPAWFFRGYYPEAAGAIIISLVLLAWSLSAARGPLRFLLPFGLGLAASFHPMLIVLVLPALFILVFSSEERLSGFVIEGVAFCLGILPLVLVTRYVCQPYGNLLSIGTLISNCRFSGAHRVASLFAVGCLALALVAFILPWTRKLLRRDRIAALLNMPSVATAACVVLLLFSLVPCFVGSQTAVMKSACLELYRSVDILLGLVLLGCAAATLAMKEPARSRVVLMLVLLALPVFLYLKGVEQYGLWSQRRLLPVSVVTIVALLPAGALACLTLANVLGGRHLVVAACGFAFLSIAGLANMARCPAPYLLRQEAGAQAWVDGIAERIGNRLAFFDYYQHSVPFAVRPGMRVLGLGRDSRNRLDQVVPWLRDRAAKEDMIWVTAFQNPGIEDGLALQSTGRECIALPRATGKHALPVVEKTSVVDMTMLRAIPITAGKSAPTLNKVMDGGPLALRGPWGKSRAITLAGREMPATWSREGSGVVGPMPAPGNSVRITIEGAASRDDGTVAQVLKITPPWEGNGLLLATSNTFSTSSGTLTRPSDQKDDGSRTGTYRIFSEKPYDPAAAGIKGYDKDLGARIHRIRIEVVPSAPVP